MNDPGSYRWPDQPRSASEAIAAEMRAGNPFDRRHREEQLANLNARHTRREEMGEYSAPQMVYSLDEDTRDRLLAHAREDAAHALSLAIFIHRRQRRHGYALGIAVALLAYIAWRMT